MSHFIRNIPCPNCRSNGKDRSGNNLGVYSDGHKVCWAGCGYWEPPDIRLRLATEAPSNSSTTIMLPSDSTPALPAKALLWLNKYQLTREEIVDNRFLWSDEKQSLIFPVYDQDNNLLMHQSRYMGLDPKHPKYITKGYKDDVLHILGTQSETIILVEDLISAIKVARHGLAMPLWGSSISQKTLKRLSERFENLVVWLDYDKTMESRKIARVALQGYFKTTRSVITREDPKELSNERIKECLK